MFDREFLEKIFEEMRKVDAELKEKQYKDENPSYEELEYDCQTTITDEDMLQIQINQALDSGNKELFISLTNEMNKEKLPF